MIVQSKVKEYVKSKGKQMGSDAMAALEREVVKILDRAIQKAGSFTRIRAGEVVSGQ